MFGVNKEQLVNGLCRLAAHLCAYTKQPCDCKYMCDKDQHIASHSESGSGCPELTMAASMLTALSNQEFADLAKKAGVQIGNDAPVTINVFETIRQYQDQRWQKQSIKPSKRKPNK